MPSRVRIAAAVQWFVFSYQVATALLVYVVLRENAPAVGLETLPAMAVAVVAAAVGYARASADVSGAVHARRVESVVAFSVFAVVASFLTGVLNSLVFGTAFPPIEVPPGFTLVLTSIDTPLAAVAALALAYVVDVRWLFPGDSR